MIIVIFNELSVTLDVNFTFCFRQYFTVLFFVYPKVSKLESYQNLIFYCYFRYALFSVKLKLKYERLLVKIIINNNNNNNKYET